MKNFEYKGVSSAAFDIVCKSINRPILPGRRPRTIEIYGKAGIVDYGGGDYGTTPITIKIAYTGVNSTEFRARSRDVSAWLSSDKWEKLIVDDEPDKYYLARITSAIDFETFTKLGHATIVFECQPFAYSTGYHTHSTEEGALTFYNPGTKEINFHCPQGSKSSIVVTGTWTSFTLALNGEMLEYTEAGSGTVTFDNIEMEVDLDGLNKLSVVDGDIDKFLSIKPGENTIYITGADLDVTVTVDYIPMWL